MGRTPFASSSRAPRGFARLACTAGLCAALALGGVLAPAGQAFAATAETESELARLSGEVQAATATYSAATSKADELQKQVDELANDILELEQEKIPAQRKKASEAATNLYKMQNDSANMLSSLLGSSSFGEFLNLAKYLGVIENKNVSELEDMNALNEQLQAKMAEVSASKDEAVKQEETAAQALAQAKDAQQQMQAKADAEDAAEAEAARKAAEEAAAQLAAAQEQAARQKAAAEAAAQQQATSNGAGATTAPTGNGSAQASAPAAQPAQPSQAPQSSQPSQPAQKPATDSGTTSNAGSNSGSSGDGTASSASGWKTGVASYYGLGDGLMGSATASGEPVTETSMGIAMLNVPLGTRVEISYGGRSVIAVVNDRGPYAHGRVIDMQPAVARQLGFISAGVGTVRYRFL